MTAETTFRETTRTRSRPAPLGAGPSEVPSSSDESRARTAATRRWFPSVSWPARYSSLVLTTDLVAILVATTTALLFSLPLAAAEAPSGGNLVAAIVLVVLWLASLAAERSRDRRIVGIGVEEYGRVWRSTWHVFAAVALAAYFAEVDLSRGFVAIALPLGTGLLLVGRYGARGYLKRLRRRGRALSRIVLTGSRSGVAELAREIAARPHAGYVVVGVCVPGGDPLERAWVGDVPVLGDVLDVPHTVTRVRADAVAVVGADHINASVVRDLGYRLESTGTDLIVAPGLVDVAGPRMVLSPAEGLSLVHVDAPQFTGVRYVVKAMMDWVGAFVVVALLAVPMLVIAAAIRLTSKGPALYRQERVGRDGRTFRMIKFRSMRVGADAERAVLDGANEGNGVLFKLKDDPRVTPLGKFLRRYSLDELPQLINVLRGEMSLVGPRPPLPSEVAHYDGYAPRRMLVKPGLTGLWQISGRSDLSWDEGLRKDLFYVENWTLAGDLLILLRTAKAVFAHSGAY